MKTLSLLSILIFSQSIFANSLTSFFKSEQADFLCKKAKLEEGNTAKTLIKEIEASDNFVIVGFSDRNDAVISINNLAGEEIVKLNLKGEIRDIKLENEIVYILIGTELRVYDISQLKFVSNIRTLPENYEYTKYIIPFELTVSENKIFIAHGEIGIIQVAKENLVIEKVLNIIVPQPHSGHRSLFSGVAFNNDQLFIGVDNITYDFGKKKRAFEGVVVFDLEKNKNTKVISVNQRQEAYHEPSMIFSDRKLYINNLNLYFEHGLKNIMNTRRYLRPDKRIYNFKPGYLVNKGFIKNGHMHGCFEERETFKLVAGSSKI